MIKILFVIIILGPLFSFAQPNTWLKKNDFGGGKRERAVAFSIGDYGYIGTGVDTAENVLKDLWQYDPIVDTWTQKADLPGEARRDAVGFALGNKGYIGTGINNIASFFGNKLADFWEYNPTTNTWTQKANFPGNGGFGIYFATGFVVDSKGYICGGKNGPNTYSNQLWEYKPSIDQWTVRANFPGGQRYQLSSFSIGNYGYVGLGANQDIFKKDFWKYNPGNNEWMQIADLIASERGGATTFTIGDRGFVCTGTNGGTQKDLIEYNPISNTWALRSYYGGSDRKNAVAFVVNGMAYLGTGKGNNKKASMYEYTPHNFLGLNESGLVDLKIYPNPTTDFILIQSNANLIEEIVINSIDGKEFKREKMEGSIHKIELKSALPGVYFVQVIGSDGNQLDRKQIIVQ